MALKARFDVRLATQVLVLQVAVVVLTLGIAGGLLAFFSHQRIAGRGRHPCAGRGPGGGLRTRGAADVARYDDAGLTPSAPLTDELARGQLQLIASEVQKRTDVLFVVITNDQGIRLAHPNLDELGRHVSTDPAQALAGHEAVVRQSGTLGPSVRAKVPVLRPDSQSSGRRGQRRHLDVGRSSAAVDRCADGGSAGRRWPC